MHRLLERFSAFAATGVVLVYLGGLFLGTATYFVGRAIGTSPDLDASIGFALALAVEVHSFLSQRLTRSHFQQRNKLDEAQADWDAADRQFRIHLGITCGLVAFSVFNSIAFWALVMRPQTIGDWLQVVVRGLIVPLAFLAAGFLTPLSHDAAQLLQDASAVMLRQTVKVTVKQWRRRVARARKAGIDLAPVAVELMEDAREVDAARRIRIIAHALDVAEGRVPERAHILPPPEYTPDEAFDIAWDRPPTGPGSPVASRRRASKRGKGSHKRAAVIRLQTSRRDVETAIRALLGEQPGMSIRQLSKRAGVSESTASKYRRIIMAEGMQQTREAMAQ